MRTAQNNTHRRLTGFTVVEMLVVLPIALILIMVIVHSVTRLTNAAVISGEKSRRTIELNNALALIEQDVSVTNQFLSRATLRDKAGHIDSTMLDYLDLTSPQNKNSIHFGIMPNYLDADRPVHPFSDSQPRLFLNRLATITNPNADEAIKRLAHYNEGPFSGADCKYNPPVLFNVVYYVSGESLYRRVIMPYRKSDGAYNKELFCHWMEGGHIKYEMPWQQPSCNNVDYNAPGGFKKKYCVSEDQKVIDQVDFRVEYLDGYGNNIPHDKIYNQGLTLDQIQEALDDAKAVRVKIESKIGLTRGAVETVVKGEVVVSKISDTPIFQ